MPNTIADNLARLQAARTSIAGAITAKGGTVTAGDGFEDFPTDIATIPSGGGGSVSENDVTFYDYDGTVVNAYSKTDFLALSAMPANPTHEGLTAQGWNWSLADAKAYVTKYGRLNIGQMYITSDGKTRLYITLHDGRKSPVLKLYLNANTEVDVDWGDGSTHTTWTSTSAGYQSERHAYASAGDYVIAITVVDGSIQFTSSSASMSLLLTNGNGVINSPNRAYLNSIQKIEIGSSVTSISIYAFYSCTSLTSITIPDSVTSIRDYAFQNCFSLTSVTIPDSVTSIGDYAFQSCYSLASVVIPDSVTSIGSSAFQGGCFSLTSVTIPDSVTSIGVIAFQSCYSLASVVIPDSVTSIGNGVFQSCFSLTSVVIPDSVTSIGNGVFQSCYSIGYLRFDGITPPTASSNAFINIPTDCTIYVPTGSLSAYTSASNYPSSSTYNYVEY